MADSTSPIQQIAAGSNAVDRVNENFDAASPVLLYGRDARTTAGLTWGYIGGRWGGAAVANGAVTLTASATNYVVANRSNGVVSSSTATADWANTDAYLRLYLVVTGAASVTSYQDHRQAYGAAGGGGGGGVIVPAPVVVVSGTSNDITAGQANSYLRFTATTAKTCTWRTQAAHALPADAEWHVRNAGAGNLTLTAASGVTLNAPAGGTLVVPPAGTVTIKRVAVDVFDVMGQTA